MGIGQGLSTFVYDDVSSLELRQAWATTLRIESIARADIDLKAIVSPVFGLVENALGMYFPRGKGVVFYTPEHRNQRLSSRRRSLSLALETVQRITRPGKKVLDLTAGWCRDTSTLALNHIPVAAFEKSEAIFYIAADGLRRTIGLTPESFFTQLKNGKSVVFTDSLTLTYKNSLDVLRETKRLELESIVQDTQVGAIYLDPMYDAGELKGTPDKSILALRAFYRAKTQDTAQKSLSKEEEVNTFLNVISDDVPVVIKCGPKTHLELPAFERLERAKQVIWVRR